MERSLGRKGHVLFGKLLLYVQKLSSIWQGIFYYLTRFAEFIHHSRNFIFTRSRVGSGHGFYKMVAHFTMRTYGVNQVIRSVEGIWLHRKSCQI